MSTMAVAHEDERNGDGAAGGVMLAVADGLTGQGLEIVGPWWGYSQLLKIMNARGAFCEVAIDDAGSVCWEYRPLCACKADPAQVAAMVLDVLTTDDTERDCAAPEQYAGMTLKGAAALVLRDRGMQVSLEVVVPEDLFCEVYGEIKVINPARRDRGLARVTDDGVLRWECRLSDPSRGIAGIDSGEVAVTIAKAVASGNGQFPERLAA
jgi:hypothetical protein